MGLRVLDTVQSSQCPPPSAAENTLLEERATAIRAAARTDMEFRSAAAVPRHHVENLLAAFSFAICRRDAAQLGELIHDQIKPGKYRPLRRSAKP